MDGLTKLPERNLDVLRAIAVLLVVSDHLMFALGRELPFVTDWALGRTGVLLFFVHTSLVLMSSLERAGAGGNWIRAFYVRRAFRIFPLAITVTLATVLLHVPSHAGPPGQPNPFIPTTAKVLLSNLTLTQNLVGARDVQGVLWSLPLEVQMYVVLPLAFLLARRSPRGTLVTLIVCTGAAVAFPYVRAAVPFVWRVNVIAFSPFFMFGVLCYSLLHLGYRMPEIPPSRFASTAKTICTYSYGIYLLHVPSIWFAFTILHVRPIVQWATFTLLVIALPYLAYRLIERPGITFGKRITSSSGWAQRLMTNARCPTQWS